jgi:hypothetical protein
MHFNLLILHTNLDSLKILNMFLQGKFVLLDLANN